MMKTTSFDFTSKAQKKRPKKKTPEKLNIEDENEEENPREEPSPTAPSLPTASEAAANPTLALALAVGLLVEKIEAMGHATKRTRSPPLRQSFA